jgi:hypothetical protein
MVEVLEFALQDMSHFTGCLIFLLCVCWAISNFTLVRIERNSYDVSSDLIKEQLDKELKGEEK